MNNKRICLILKEETKKKYSITRTFAIFEKTVIFIIVFLILFLTTMHSLNAESQFDSDDMIFEDETSSRFDSDDILFLDSDTEDKQEKQKKSLFHKVFVNDSKFTLGYEFSYALDLEPDIVTNDAYFRQETQTLMFGDFFLQFDGQFKLMVNSDHRSKAKNRDFLINSSIREFYIQKGFENFNITFGKQIIVWGKADTGIITDVVSPRDNSDFIFIKLEDSRFGQTMLSSTVYTHMGRMFFFIAPKPLTDKEPDEGTRYYIPDISRDYYILTEQKPDYSDVEYGTRLEKSFGKTDLSLMTGHFIANTGMYDFVGIDCFSLKPVVQKKYHDYKMIGIAGTYTKDSYLFKIETAFKQNYSLQGINLIDLIYSVEKDILDASVGIEYNANERYMLSVELAHRHIQGNMINLPFDNKRSTSLYTIFSKDFLNQTESFEYIFYYHIQENNAFHQIRLTSDITDNFQMITSMSFFDIKDENSLLWLFKNENRFTVDIKYFF